MMYNVYQKEDARFDTKNLIGEFKDLDDAYDRVEKELDKNPNFKFRIEETDGHVNNYGDLIETLVAEN